MDAISLLRDLVAVRQRILGRRLGVAERADSDEVDVLRIDLLEAQIRLAEAEEAKGYRTAT